MQAIVEHLEKYGEQIDKDIAQRTGLSLATVRTLLTEMEKSGEVVSCKITKYVDGKKVEGISCRLKGYIPKQSGGRPAKVQISL
ncbi:ArsR family transcriptional regulator [Methylobacillus gramineus]|uniref:ArsR family transcriptional regulator n=1 Tax=Methylobacillus gramineus TaxID=755169 RepID=UPI001CFF9F87|nr:ArsR family transcriptional regulator [Methylobacillus gramineus]MCB5184960.1 ArsR family transcriptional regulator [Methylobacillus gramineus]